MNKKNHNQKHLTLSDRVYIEQELLQGSTFRSIAGILHKDPSTISKEIHLHAMMPTLAELMCSIAIHMFQIKKRD